MPVTAAFPVELPLLVSSTSSSCRISQMTSNGPYFLQVNPSGTTALVTRQNGANVTQASDTDFANNAEFVFGTHYRASA
jgi:hypothetical protein